VIGRCLLDTNVVIALFADDPAVLALLQDCEEVFVSSVVLGELYYGAAKSAHAVENTRRIDEFASSIAVLPCTQETARRYGRLKESLLSKGTPIPENDLWIAAHADEHQLTLTSRDDHFRHITSLSLHTC